MRPSSWFAVVRGREMVLPVSDDRGRPSWGGAAAPLSSGSTMMAVVSRARPVDEVRTTLRVRIGGVCLALVSAGILVFGIVVAVAPTGGDALLYRADGLASIGLGLFGGLIVVIPYRRAERWTWWALWFYPLFWLAHLIWGLPPGTDHVHQVVFIALSLLGLLLPVRRFFPKGLGMGAARR